MDDSRIAFDRFVGGGCNDRIFTFNLAINTSKRISRCLSDYGSRQLAVAGRRIAWINTECGNGECDDDLWASLPRPKPRLLATAYREGDVGAGILEGDWIGGLVGSGGLLAVNLWTTDANGVTTTSKLDVIGGKHLQRVVSGPNAIYAQAADSGRIAVLREDGTVGIYSAVGKLLVEVKPSSVAKDENFNGDAIALQDNYLLVLTRTRRLEVYNSHSGALLHSWPVRKGATNLDARAGVAAYAEYPFGPGSAGTPYKVHVVRLATGKDAVLGKGKVFSGLRDIEIESAGLVYVKNPLRRLGKVTLVFVPLGRVLAAVS